MYVNIEIPFADSVWWCRKAALLKYSSGLGFDLGVAINFILKKLEKLV